MKTFIVTGSTKGIGLALVKKLQSTYSDTTIYMSYAHDEAAAQECYNELSKNGSVFIDKVDMSSYESAKAYCDKIKADGAKIDGLLLNAGIGYKASIEDMSMDEWERVMRCNLNVPVYMIQQLLPILNEGSSIVMAGSMMGDYPHSGSLVYGVSKAGVHACVKNMTKFLDGRNIRINAVAPGFTKSEWHAGKSQEFFDRIASKVAVHRWAESEEIADAYIFLLENQFMNGAVLNINGGYSYF